nr:MAG TPA: Protein of unknown function (DUF722) [Caudoviricetes sp.]
MSKPRYWWYWNVCRTIGEFPKLDRQVRDMSRQKITPGYSAQPGGHSSGRAVEDIAVRVLSSREYEDYAAVQAAINTAQTWRDGADVLEVVRLHAWIWPRESLESAARRVHVSQSTAKRMYSRFVYEAARELGYRKN